MKEGFIIKKIERVKSSILFNEIIQKGNKYSRKYFTLFVLNSDKKEPLFGISAPKKIGNAVIRNKVKRRVRQIIDQTKILFPNNKNYIIIMKSDCINITYEELLNSIQNVIGDIK